MEFTKVRLFMSLGCAKMSFPDKKFRRFLHRRYGDVRRSHGSKRAPLNFGKNVQDDFFAPRCFPMDSVKKTQEVVRFRVIGGHMA
jgi:hypothetical protein